jgi:periplasmic copper chaperone A
MNYPLLRRHKLAFVAVLAAMSLFAACGDDDTSADATTSPAASIDVTAAWARTSPMVAGAGALYLTVANTGGLDDALVGASVDPSVAMSATLHETVAVPADDSVSSPTSGSGETMMEMRPVDRIVAPANGSVALEPGGYHIMLMDLAEPLVVGNTVDVTLTFEGSGDMAVTADVRDTAP